MDTRIRLYTHEVIIHSQITSIESALNRVIDFQITLNQRSIKSTLEFAVTEKEIDTLKYDLGYNVFVMNDGRWTPYL